MARTANAKLLVTRRSLAEDARTPLYSQIFLFLRNKILSGEYPNGTFVPSELEIARAFNVSRITAKRALNELAEAGLAVRQKGRGTRVRNKGGGTIVSGSIQSLVDSLRANARNQSVRLVAFDYVPAPLDIAFALRLAPGADVQRAERVCSADGRPYSHLTTYIPAAIGAQWSAEELERSGMMSQLERAGVPIAFAEQVITATLADAELAAALDVPIGSALIRAVRVSFAEGDEPTEYLIAHYAPDLYQFMMTLTNEAD
jgi:GntR family transcriptional regulator